MTSTPHSSTSDSIITRLTSRWPLVLFALPFAGVGIGMLLFAVIPTILDGQSMRNWHEASAQLHSAGVKTHRGDDSTTYSAFATYSYPFNGQTYRGDRVAISNSADNIGDFNQSLGNRLARAYDNKQTVPVYINPDNPNEAVLNRDIRWGKVGFYFIFVFTFGGVGVGMLCYAALSRPQELSIEEKDADKPWLTQRDWAGPQIHSQTKLTMWAAWGFAAFWNCIAIPAGIMVTIEGFKGNYIALIGLLFPAVGLGLIIFAVRTTLSWRRFGKTPLTMDPYPGAIGGQIGGSITLAIPYDASVVFKTTVQCAYSYMSGSGKDRSRRENIEWQADGIAHTRPAIGGTIVEVLFDVDAGLPESDKKTNSSYHLWRLMINAEMPGIDFDRQFEIPVFATAQRATQLTQLSTEHDQAIAQRDAALEAVLNIQQVPGGLEIYYPAFRHPAGKIVGAVFGAIFVAVGWFAYQHGASIIFPIAFGAVGSLIFLWSTHSLLASLTVHLDRQYLLTEKRLLGILVRRRKIPRHEVTKLILATSYTSTSGKKQTTYYAIKAETLNNGKITVGYNLAGKQVADHALESIGMLTGIPYG